LFQRHIATILFGIYSLFCLGSLSWSADAVVRVLKASFYYILSPVSVPVMTETDTWRGFTEGVVRLIQLDQEYLRLQAAWQKDRIDEKRVRELETENQRLTTLLDLPPQPRHKNLVCRVLSRDANDWFHSLLISRGRADGVEISDPVVAFQDGQEVLVGRVAEVFEKTSRVILVTDPLSAVSVRSVRTKEQGAVEGQGTERLIMNYLFSDSAIAVGDAVVTAGLGDVFPPGIVIGTVEGLQSESRESFKRAVLKPALHINRIQEVVVLRRQGAA